MPEQQRGAAERIVDRAVEDAEGVGRPLERRSTQYQRSIENYLKAGNRPRWMERLVEIDRGVAQQRERLGRLHARMREEHGASFPARWREVAERWDFGELNTLIHQHNEWFPIERQLPIDLRTRDYVLIRGKSYRRRQLDAAWILETFPAEP